jgi:tRNA (guanine6-N2)-methyltransferase
VAGYKVHGLDRRARQPARVPEGKERRRAPVSNVELLFLPGLDDVVADEVRERLGGVVRHVRAVPDRDDSLAVAMTGPLKALLGMRTIVAPFLVLAFPVPRPKSLLSGEYFPTIVDAIREVGRLNPADPPTSLRIEAAGRDSTVLRNFADQLAQATGLHHDDEFGECVVRLRRTPGQDGWDVLVRLSTLPLSARPWRAEGYHAAVNATVAAAMVRLSKPAASDRVVNLMCGSGTILVERLLAGYARAAVGIDRSGDAIAAAEANVSAAGLTGRVELMIGDVAQDDWVSAGPFDRLYADPPWGDKSGRHSESEDLHQMLLERAYAGAAEGARLVVLTHEIRIMERCLRRASSLWRLDSETRVFQKGHHPRIYLLTKEGRRPGRATGGHEGQRLQWVV